MSRPIILAAGGTGGHFFPAEALAAELLARGHRIALLTDARSGALDSPVFADHETITLHGSGIAGRGALQAASSALALARGTMEARRHLARLRPAAIVGFGGYPTIPPILAAQLLATRPPIILHEQNAVLGRANRALARFASTLALGMDATARLPNRPHSVTGNPVRPAIQALAGRPYPPPEPGGPIHLLVTGGSLGARIFSTIVPQAIAQLPQALRARLRIVQQARPEDAAQVVQAYATLAIPAEVAPFFPDLPARLAASHLVIARAGASTVAEIAAVARPALLVPLPAAIDDHQSANAAAIAADILNQPRFTPEALASYLAQTLPSPFLLAQKAHAIAPHGRPDAAATLATLVERLLRPSTGNGTQPARTTHHESLPA